MKNIPVISQLVIEKYSRDNWNICLVFEGKRQGEEGSFHLMPPFLRSHAREVTWPFMGSETQSDEDKVRNSYCWKPLRKPAGDRMCVRKISR